jgi:hypothetical protein
MCVLGTPLRYSDLLCKRYVENENIGSIPAPCTSNCISNTIHNKPPDPQPLPPYNCGHATSHGLQRTGTHLHGDVHPMRRRHPRQRNDVCRWREQALSALRRDVHRAPSSGTEPAQRVDLTPRPSQPLNLCWSRLYSPRQAVSTFRQRGTRRPHLRYES